MKLRSRGSSDRPQVSMYTRCPCTRSWLLAQRLHRNETCFRASVFSLMLQCSMASVRAA